MVTASNPGFSAVRDENNRAGHWNRLSPHSTARTVRTASGGGRHAKSRQASTPAKSQSITVAYIHVTSLSQACHSRKKKLVIHRADHRIREGAEQCAVSGAFRGKLWRSWEAAGLGQGPRCLSLEHRGPEHNAL